MLQRLKLWCQSIWQKKWWLILLALYKIIEDWGLGKLVGYVEEHRGGLVDFLTWLIDYLPWVTWIAIPITIVVLLVLTWRKSSRIQVTTVAVPISTNLAETTSTQEYIAERLSFIQQLRATQERLVKNVHFNIPESVAHFFTKFCEEPDVRTIVQPDSMATISLRLITERFHNLTSQSLEHQERGKKLTSSTITDGDIRYECNKISQTVREYRYMVDEWMKFTEALAAKGMPRFWEKAPWSVNIHKKLADDYDELMALVKTLRHTTPTAFQNLLLKDHELIKFPRATLWG